MSGVEAGALIWQHQDPAQGQLKQGRDLGHRLVQFSLLSRGEGAGSLRGGEAVIAETLESIWQVIRAQWGGRPDWCRPEIESLSTLQVSNPIPKPLARYPQQAGFGLGPCVSSVPSGVYISSGRKWKGTVDQA